MRCPGSSTLPGRSSGLGFQVCYFIRQTVPTGIIKEDHAFWQFPPAPFSLRDHINRLRPAAQIEGKLREKKTRKQQWLY
jgi:hypothetical protein